MSHHHMSMALPCPLHASSPMSIMLQPSRCSCCLLPFRQPSTGFMACKGDQWWGGWDPATGLELEVVALMRDCTTESDNSMQAWVKLCCVCAKCEMPTGLWVFPSWNHAQDVPCYNGNRDIHGHQQMHI